MATTRLMPLHTGKGRTVGQAISAIIDYTENPQKTDGGRLITSWQCDSRIADAEFLFAKNQYTQKTGRVRGEDDVIAYHLRQSFVPGEITPEEANRLGCELAKRFTKGNHAFVVCTHIDKSHVHNHIIWSAVNADCDRKFRNFWGSTKAIRRLSDTICIENGLSIVENPKSHGKSYNKWLGDQAKPSHRELLRVAIDNALSQSPIDFEELLKLLQESGCEVSKRGKSYRLKLPGWEKVARIDSLGEGYGLEDLQAVLSGKKAHTPRKKIVTQAETQKVNLLVDIQAKLQAGKGAGYARWAKVFNLKQMAQTMNYLSAVSYTHLVDTASEALAVSISEKACVDMSYMSRLTGKTKEELAGELQGVIFRVPGQLEKDGTPHFVTADEYLSGNVRRKLRQAQRAAQQDPSFAVNVEALTAAQPKDLDASEIEVRLGATWIDKEYILSLIHIFYPKTERRTEHYANQS